MAVCRFASGLLPVSNESSENAKALLDDGLLPKPSVFKSLENGTPTGLNLGAHDIFLHLIVHVHRHPGWEKTFYFFCS